MRLNSLGLKISLFVTLIIAIIITSIVYIVTTETDKLIEGLVIGQTDVTSNILVQSIDDLMDSALGTAELIAQSATVISAIETGNEALLRETLLMYGSSMDIVTLADSKGNVLMRTHNDTRGDSVINQNAIATALNTGRGIRTIEKGTVVGFSTRGSSAIFGTDGSIIGAVTCGHDLSQPKYVDAVKELGNCEVTIFDGTVRMNTTIIGADGQRAIGTELNNPTIEQAVLRNGQTFRSRIPLFGHQYAVTYYPLTIDGNILGILFTGINIEQTIQDQNAKVRMVLTVSISIGVASAILVFVLSLFMVSKPMKKISLFTEKIKNGDLGISSASSGTISVSSSDEVGSLARALEQAYAQLRGYVGEIKQKMEAMSNGDLTSDSNYEFHGDFVLIKNSINDIVRTLNSTMSEINSSTTQVAQGSRQIADGAQALAQGSTQQAASVEQLSASISEIAEKTQENADMAGRAAALANSIKTNAEKGSAQMDEMTSAVREINQASQSISKVIKVIDDIAFQTNILALNAAVEAARAGQHGKGFAVVAEEVRNLAAKSAEAAKDTGGLIANSMEKAELGARIADETAASLAEIVNGINESNKIVGDIAKSSEEQSIGIRQVNTGIDQVAQVVQQNSATAQQSAAASQEMSRQSATLETLIAQFRLKGGASPSPRGLPPVNKARPAAPSIPSISDDQNIGSGNFGKY